MLQYSSGTHFTTSAVSSVDRRRRMAFVEGSDPTAVHSHVLLIKIETSKSQLTLFVTYTTQQQQLNINDTCHMNSGLNSAEFQSNNSISINVFSLCRSTSSLK